jgi:hypothetical protein
MNFLLSIRLIIKYWTRHQNIINSNKNLTTSFNLNNWRLFSKKLIDQKTHKNNTECNNKGHQKNM